MVRRTFPRTHRKSKDEKVRNALIKAFESLNTINVWNGIKRTDILNWLEKQGDNLVENGYTNNKDFIKYADNYSHEIWHKLMDNFKNIKDYYIGCNDVSDIVLNAIIDTCNWLEKQCKETSEPNWCHHKVDLSDCSEEYRKAYYDGWNNCNMQYSQCKSEGDDVVKCLINGMKFYCEDNEEATWGTEKFSMKVKDIISWLEKQGNQKVTVAFKSTDWYVSKVDGKIHNIYGSNKATNADKVEPPSFDEAQGTPIIKKCKEHKFEKGNWIVGNKVVCQILAIYIGGYIVDKDNCELFIPFEDEELYHLWTIKDAKKGDVLFVKPTENLNRQLIIFGGINSDSRIEYYCSFLNNKFSINGGLMGYDHKYFLPATKEQHDVLMKAMTDAGYTFDFEKKELRKIKKND